MRYVIDSSVWIETFRSPKGPIAQHLSDLLDDDDVVLTSPVKAELLLGCIQSWKSRLEVLLSSVHYLSCTEPEWQKVFAWAKQSRSDGLTFALGDLLIAATAGSADLPLWTLDTDFERMEKLGWIKLYKPKN